MERITPIRSRWKGTMTPRERFNRQMHFKSVDRCFNMEFGYWDENYIQWDIFTRNGITGEAEANEFFAFDPIEAVYGNIWMSPPFEYKETERRGDKIIIQNADGLTAEISADRHSSIPHFVNSSVKTPDDWKRVKEERFRLGDPSRVPDVAQILERHPADRDYPLGINCGSMIGRIRDMLTFEGVCYAWADYPDMLEDMVETSCRLVEQMLDQVLGKVDFDYASGWEDICFNHGPILPPSFFNEVVGPRYKRISDKLRAHGIDLWYTDCDGDVRPLLPVFLETGINCLFPFEVNSCTHPGTLLNEYENLRIMGGVDKMQLIAGKDAIRSYLEGLVPLVRRGGFIPFCDHRCPPDVTPENYLYYLDLKEKLFG
jgi:uroporphyrinogen decarboxylase